MAHKKAAFGKSPPIPTPSGGKATEGQAATPSNPGAHVKFATSETLEIEPMSSMMEDDEESSKLDPKLYHMWDQATKVPKDSGGVAPFDIGNPRKLPPGFKLPPQMFKKTPGIYGGPRHPYTPPFKQPVAFKWPFSPRVTPKTIPQQSPKK